MKQKYWSGRVAEIYLEGTSMTFDEHVKGPSTTHHIRMFPMFNDMKEGNVCGIGTKLHCRNSHGISGRGQKKDSYIESFELPRSLSLASPRGFLFRLYKNEPGKSLSQGKIEKCSKSDRREDLYTAFAVGNNQRSHVSSIIQKSILQRRNLALKSASKLTELRIEGANKFTVTSENDSQSEHFGVRISSGIGLKGRKQGTNLLPLLPKHRRTHDSSLQQTIKAVSNKVYPSLRINCNQILPRQPEEKIFQNRPKEKSRGSNDQNCEGKAVDNEEARVFSGRTPKRRTINVFLPNISTDQDL
ncbi:hypothetical protein AWC38_SpisGene19780 [Stylophora pistillata]|uniref:Uncharacterized protein n=1 Tax=Stylophora pistillata TaxID=50429 RepID=A0A2B4RGN1_STYPI|nr:hypothetical protein AWC38_SpisGene19780 [Stylophora pistillata]